MSHQDKEYLISGSFAYDTILNHAGQFQARILPESISRLNVAFGVSNVSHDFGGTGGNIAYNAGLLGNDPMLIGSLGVDRQDYEKHLAAYGLDISTLTVHKGERTAHAWVLSDMNNNQITAFDQGAMRKMPVIPDETPQLWHLAPDNHETTATLAKSALAQDKQYFFDPGQALPGFIEGSAKDIMPLEELLFKAEGIFLNDYEAELLIKHFGEPLNYWLTNSRQFVIKTMGGNGLELITTTGVVKIPVAECSVIIDPTGCGDALRAGFLHAYIRNHELVECAKLGAAMGSFAIERAGGQKHLPTLDMAIKRAANIII